MTKKIILGISLLVICAIVGTTAYILRQEQKRQQGVYQEFKTLHLTIPFGATVTQYPAEEGGNTLKIEFAGSYLALFDKADYNGGGPDWIMPHTSERVGEWLPSQPDETLEFKGKTKTYGMWLFYAKADEMTKKSLHNIVQSIQEIR